MYIQTYICNVNVYVYVYVYVHVYVYVYVYIRMCMCTYTKIMRSHVHELRKQQQRRTNGYKDMQVHKYK